MPDAVHAGVTIVAINVGGALIPALLSLYLFFRVPLRARMMIGTVVVATVVHQLAQVIPGVGIVVPALMPPLIAAGVALILAYHRAPPVAYVSGNIRWGVPDGNSGRAPSLIPAFSSPPRPDGDGRDPRLSQTPRPAS